VHTGFQAAATLENHKSACKPERKKISGAKWNHPGGGGSVPLQAHSSTTGTTGPTKMTKQQTRPRRRPRVLTEDELDEALDIHPPDEIRNWASVLLYIVEAWTMLVSVDPDSIVTGVDAIALIAIGVIIDRLTKSARYQQRTAIASERLAGMRLRSGC
jgi:hypothetical protein